MTARLPWRTGVVGSWDGASPGLVAKTGAPAKRLALANRSRDSVNGQMHGVVLLSLPLGRRESESMLQ